MFDGPTNCAEGKDEKLVLFTLTLTDRSNASLAELGYTDAKRDRTNGP